MGQIKPGARVRVTLDAHYVREDTNVRGEGGMVVEFVSGQRAFLPTSDPISMAILPPVEPTRRAAVVETFETFEAGESSELYVRRYDHDDSDTRPCRMEGHREWMSWVDVTAGAESVRVLFEGVADDD